jgi:hypothetical protein
MCPVALKHVEKQIKQRPKSSSDSQLLERIRILEEENASLRTIMANPETIDAKRNIILRSRISILERQVSLSATTIKQFENQAGVVSEIRDLCRGLMTGGNIEESVKKQVKKLAGRLVQAEYRHAPVVETRDDSVRIDEVEPKLHVLFDLICRLEAPLTKPCVLMSFNSQIKDKKVFKETKEALVSCMDSLLDSQKRVTTTKAWMGMLPRASDRKMVGRMVDEEVYRYKSEIAARGESS